MAALSCTSCTSTSATVFYEVAGSFALGVPADKLDLFQPVPMLPR